ncbi:hypothetical protein Clacol_008896 [Clathrus columnatus]|uniref:Uncharacterized protein n=1 Tax=Clathrus columnatus TaxID=1419009 RepID=A0AAV5AP70_9AGAM|nr:hypothetical protein Clacol_008896 [Clathrus columnatus]
MTAQRSLLVSQFLPPRVLSTSACMLWDYDDHVVALSDMSSVNSLHRRKSSRENDGQLVVTITEPTTPLTVDREDDVQDRLSSSSLRKPTISTPDPPSGVPFPSPPRQRVLSTPSHPIPPMYSPVSSLSSHRNSLSSANAPNLSQYRNSSSHNRSPSTSSYYSPGPSPLSTTFPLLPDANSSTTPAPVAHRPAPPPPPSSTSSKRHNHNRIHSRNLSVYFPRPGVGPPSIAEDGIQEAELDAAPTPAPDILLKTDVPFQKGRELSSSFSFGGRKAENGDTTTNGRSPAAEAPLRASRRGHHHKHSLSHNFFSFMEPEPSPDVSFSSGAPTPAPTSASFSTPSSSAALWAARTPSPQSGVEVTKLKIQPPRDSPSLFTSTSASALAQFLLGAFLWMQGQETGSLSCTGLGYWVVFDAFGIALGKVLPQRLAASPLDTYGNARVETLAMFAQSIYLIFASVYVCKEAVEHALLSHDHHGHGHHHHRGDEFEEDYGIDFPILLILTALGTLLASSVNFDNNANIVGATSNRLPSLNSFFEPDQHISTSEPSRTAIGRASSNPYTVLPFAMGLFIIGIWALGNTSYHRQADLLLAFVMAVLTFWASYPAVVALGKVLLQTAPDRSKNIRGKSNMRSDGRMEGFLRVMREFERHPQIFHLPPPHIWQLTPSIISSSSSSFSDTDTSGRLSTLIVTLELHISQDLDDESTLKLTKWAWERCMGVLGGAAEVTVGIVRG